MKPFVTIHKATIEPAPRMGDGAQVDVVKEHDTIDTAKAFASSILLDEKAEAEEVHIFQRVHRGVREITTKFDSGMD